MTNKTEKEKLKATIKAADAALDDAKRIANAALRASDAAREAAGKVSIVARTLDTETAYEDALAAAKVNLKTADEILDAVKHEHGHALQLYWSCKGELKNYKKNNN